jgi:threonine/homoserine/homoserine lactone efflux protein
MPSLQVTLAFAAIVALIVVSPGPNLFLLLRNTPTLGRYVGLINTLGVCGAILSHAFLSLIGVSAIIVASATLFGIVKLLGAAYLVWLGVKSLRSAFAEAKLPEIEPGTIELTQKPSLFRAFAQGWAVNILNPKPALFYLAAFPQFIDPSAGPVFLQGMALAGVHAVIAAIWYGSVVLGIDRANVWLRRPRVWQTVQGVSGVALVGLGTRLAFARPPNP